MIRTLINGNINYINLPWIALAALMFFGALRGIDNYGINASIVSFRQDFYFIVMALYVQTITFKPSDIDDFSIILIIAAGFLVVYAVVCWIDPSFAIRDSDEASPFFLSDSYLGWRVLSASSALLIAQAGLIGFVLWLRSNRINMLQLTAVPLLLMVVMLYHRSVWISSAAAIAVLVVRQRTLIHRVALPAAAMALIVVAIVGLGGDMVTSAVQSAVTEPFRDNSTWGWRINNWRNMIPETFAAGPITTLLGWGYGASFQDMVTGRILANPHNAYVAFFLNIGLLGLISLLVCLFMPFFRLWRGEFPASDTFDRLTAIALLSLLIAYYIPYSISVDHGIILGVLTSLAANCRVPSRQRPVARPLGSIPAKIRPRT